jgi:hypothetical protein
MYGAAEKLEARAARADHDPPLTFGLQCASYASLWHYPFAHLIVIQYGPSSGVMLGL